MRRVFIQIQKHLGSPVTSSQKISGILLSSFPIRLISLFGSFFALPYQENKTLISLACIFFFLGKRPSYFYSCHAFETTICEFTWYITYKMYVYGILANDGLTSFLKEHLIILLNCVFTTHLVKESYARHLERQK